MTPRTTRLFDAAKRFGNIVIVTRDEDFADRVSRLGAPPQIVWITGPNLKTPLLQAALQSTLADALARINAGDELVEIAIDES